MGQETYVMTTAYRSQINVQDGLIQTILFKRPFWRCQSAVTATAVKNKHVSYSKPWWHTAYFRRSAST